MATVQVFRLERDWRGQTAGELDEYLIGTVTGVVMGGPSVQPTRNFPGVVDTTGQIGIPWAQESGIVVQQHDRLLIESTVYAVVSDRLWTGKNELTGSQPSYYWVEIRSST